MQIIPFDAQVTAPSRGLAYRRAVHCHSRVGQPAWALCVQRPWHRQRMAGYRAGWGTSAGSGPLGVVAAGA